MDQHEAVALKHLASEIYIYAYMITSVTHRLLKHGVGKRNWSCQKRLPQSDKDQVPVTSHH